MTIFLLSQWLTQAIAGLKEGRNAERKAILYPAPGFRSSDLRGFWNNLRQHVNTKLRGHESPLRVPQTQSTFHLHAR
jgi:hypothetical protein